MSALPRFIPSFIQRSALAILLSSTALAALPAYAVTNNAAPVPEATATKSHHSHHGAMHREFSPRERVEARIADLHDALDVTPDQESDWKDVAQTMRENESNVGDLIRARHANANNTNAIDDIKSYQAISQAHADSMSKFVDAFEPFYNELSSEQKQKADAYFSNFQHNMGRPMGPTPAKGHVPNDALKVK